MTTFVRDCWYVIAWDHEIPEDGLFARTVLGALARRGAEQLSAARPAQAVAA